MVGGMSGYMCKKCHYLNVYKPGEIMKCKKCDSEITHPKLELAICPKCGKKGTYKETGSYYLE